MNFENIEIMKLLPEWVREDADIQGLSSGLNTIIKSLYARIKILSRWDHIDDLSNEELNELAWELNIPWYVQTADIAVKRKIIKNSDLVHSKLGTKYSIEQLLSDYFGKAIIKEWWEYGGKPLHFKVIGTNPSMTREELEIFERLLRVSKRRSTWLDTVLICFTGETKTYAGTAIRDFEKVGVEIL